MIEMSFDQSDERVVAYIEAKGTGIVAALRKETERQMLLLLNDVVENKLTGQVLRNRTGTLRRAQHETTTEEGGTIIGKVATDPSASKYGWVHEHGGTFTVRSYLRRTSHSVGTWVREHSATFPVRSYLRSTLRERTGGIMAGLRLAVRNELAEG